MTKHVHNPRSKPPSPSPPPPPPLRLSPYGTSNARTRSRKIITYKSTVTNSMLFTGSTRTLRFLFAAPAIVRHCQRSLPTMSIVIDQRRYFFHVDGNNLYNFFFHSPSSNSHVFYEYPRLRLHFRFFKSLIRDRRTEDLRT